jgi:hypothetical protein
MCKGCIGTAALKGVVEWVPADTIDAPRVPWLEPVGGSYRVICAVV